MANAKKSVNVGLNAGIGLAHPGGHAQASDTVYDMPLSDIFVDWPWNTRGGRPEPVEDPNGNTTHEGFYSIIRGFALDGQRDACLVRPTEKGAKDSQGKLITKPFRLVYGFLRFEARQSLASGQTCDGRPTAEILKGYMPAEVVGKLMTDRPTLKVIIRKLTDDEALAANISENTQRNELGPFEKLNALDRYRQSRPDATDEQLAIIMAGNQSYISQMKRILDGFRGIKVEKPRGDGSTVKVSVLDDIRDSLTRPTMKELDAIASDTSLDKDAKGKAYLAKVTTESKGAARGKGGWIENAVTVAKEIGGYFGRLEKAGLLECNSDMWSADNIAQVFGTKYKLNGRPIPENMKKNGQSETDVRESILSRIAGEAERAYKAALKAKDAPAEKPSTSDVNGAPKAKGKGKGATATA